MHEAPASLPHANEASRELAGLVLRHARADGEHPTAIPALTLFRYSARTSPECGFMRPALILAAQGAKRVTVGGRAFEYDRSHCLITSADLPTQSQVTVASEDQPYLCVAIGIDLRRVADLLAQMRAADIPPRVDGYAISVQALAPSLVDAVLRLVRLLDSPGDIPMLAPLVEQEILYRLLTSGQGGQLRRMVMSDGHGVRVARAIDWLKVHYAEPLRIEQLAQHVNMSVSSLHHQFKSVTMLSPLQYQKQLRLQEARRLLARQVHDIGTVAQRVGYESPSQFSREYRRLFGASPLRDALQLRSA